MRSLCVECRSFDSHACHADDSWTYPQVPDAGIVTLTYCVRLAIKPYDRGIFFSGPMSAASFHALLQTLSGKGEQQCSDFDKVNLIKQASMRNYFTSAQVRVRIRATSDWLGCFAPDPSACCAVIQVKMLIDTVSYRKGKIEAAVLLHPRTTDQSNFPHALRSLDKDSDRHVRARKDSIFNF